MALLAYSLNIYIVLYCRTDSIAQVLYRVYCTVPYLWSESRRELYDLLCGGKELSDSSPRRTGTGICPQAVRVSTLHQILCFTNL